MVLYYSTGGPNQWTNDDNFANADASICQWYGVQCVDTNAEFAIIDGLMLSKFKSNPENITLFSIITQKVVMNMM